MSPAKDDFVDVWVAKIGDWGHPLKAGQVFLSFPLANLVFTGQRSERKLRMTDKKRILAVPP